MTPRPEAPIYLDHAASTPLHPQVLEAMLPWLQGPGGNPSSVHSLGRAQRSAIEQARRTVANLMGCAPAEIVFSSGGTEADNLAIWGGAQAIKARQIISSPAEHHAVLHACQHTAQAMGIPLVLIPVSEEGVVSLEALEVALKSEPQSLVSLMHGNNEVGALNPIEEIGALCHRYGGRYHSDTVQTVGHRPFQLAEQPLDYLAASAHKFRGPKGVGFLYRHPEAPLSPLLLGGPQERSQRAGTENVAGIVGLAKALELALAEQQTHARELLALKTYLWEGIQARVPQAQINGPQDFASAMPTVLNVAFPGEDTESLMLFNLDIAGICVSGGSACTSGSVHPSHVLEAMGHSPVRGANSVRFSFGPTNTQAELDYVLQVLEGMFVHQPEAAS